MLALIVFAGGSAPLAGSLALAMLLLQFAIGAANDYFDTELDTRTKPSKPVPAGLLSRRQAAVVACLCATGGVTLALISPGAVLPNAAVFGLLLLGAGLAYDAFLKRTPLSWLCFSAAFVLVLLFAWTSVAGYEPPAGPIVLVAGLLAGPALQLANGVVDLERDRSFGLRTLPVVLGQRLTVVVLATLQLTVLTIVWTALHSVAPGAPSRIVVLVAAASALSLGGVLLCAATRPRVRGVGWSLQALGLALVTISWSMLRAPDMAPAG